MSRVWITITREAAAAIRGASTAPGGFRSEAVPIPGTKLVKVPLERDTLDRIKKHQHESESISDVLIRMCSTFGKKLN